ncbi:MAG: hypothetical protein ACP5RP_02140 [Candidatus Micrarchaeia archaeon]
MPNIVGLCHICGKPARNICGMCGKPTCDEHFDKKLGVCMQCKQGRKI